MQSDRSGACAAEGFSHCQAYVPRKETPCQNMKNSILSLQRLLLCARPTVARGIASKPHRSIAHNMIEEAFEAVDAIEADDVAHMREELGNVLLQVVLQSQIAADAGEFDIDDVCRDIDAKMVRRHPHVFGDAAAQDASEVLGIWDAEKLKEKQAADAESGRASGPA